MFIVYRLFELVWISLRGLGSVCGCFFWVWRCIDSAIVLSGLNGYLGLRLCFDFGWSWVLLFLLMRDCWKLIVAFELMFYFDDLIAFGYCVACDLLLCFSLRFCLT